MKRLYRALTCIYRKLHHFVTFFRQIVTKNGQFGKTTFGTFLVVYASGCQSESGGTKK